MATKGNRLIALGTIALSVALVLGAFATIWLMPREAGSVGAQAQDKVEPARITVRGSGSVQAKPDTLVVNIGVNIQESTVQAAQTKVTSAMDAMVAKLKAAGIEEKDYRTVQYSVEPVMDYGMDKNGMAGTPKLIGFRVINILEVTFRNMAAAPEVLDQLVSAGANTIYNVSYTFADAEGLSKQAYDKAVKDAQNRAERLAILQGMTLGKVVSVTEASAGTPSIGLMDGGKGAGGPMYPGQQSIYMDLIVTYEAASSK